MLLTGDSLRQTATFWHPDPQGGVTIETVQDVQAIADRNKARYNSFDERSPWKGDWHWVGSIPMTVYWRLMQEGLLHDQTALRKWLMNPDHRAWLTRPGAL